MTSMEDHIVNRNGRFKILDKVPNPFFIGVGGGTASGKSSVCHRIMTELGQVTVDETKRKVITISQDCFYRNLTEDEQRKARNGQFNFDHPDSLDYDLMRETLKSIREGRVVHIPKTYDYRTHSRDESFETIYPADVVLFEGILVFYEQDIRDLFDMKLFVDTDPDTRLSRRVLRDTLERGRDLEKVLRNYTTFVKPAFEEFCLPTKKYADVIIPRGADNHVAIDLIVQHIKDILLGSIATNGQDSPQSESRRRRTTSESALFRPH